MKVSWQKTAHIHSRVMFVDPIHELGEWEVYHNPRAGQGVVQVGRGPSATAPPEIVAMLRVKYVWRVIAEAKGFFIVTVTEDRFWTQIEAELIQAYVLAKEKVDAKRAENEQG